MSRTRLITCIAAVVALASLAGAATAAGPAGPGTIVAPTTPPPPPLPPAPTPPTPAPALATESLTRIYRGDDGGVLYLRRLGSNVYGFGEHPGRGYAYVLRGSLAGDRISGSWWDVPKGNRAWQGSLELRFSQQGARLLRAGGHDLGPDAFDAIPATGIPWPVMQAAGFQSTSTADLDGVFIGDDQSRHYVRERSSEVVWVAERAAQPEERPGWVSVFVGERKAGGGVSGAWVDVPKGLESRSGTFGAGQIGATRELMLVQTGAQRTKRVVPEYAIDWDRFVRGITDTLNGNVVGYAYAITRHGGFVRTGAWGSRRLAIDGGKLPFTTHTQAQTASAAKLVSATAMMKALHARGLTVDARVKPFLPSCLKTGKDMATLTFRDILDHTSGLIGARDTPSDGSCNGRDPYECLLEVLAEGRTQSRDKHYNNKAYDLLRLLVPLVADPEGTKATYAFWHCKKTKGVLHRKLSERFVRYLLDEVLAPAGATASYYPGGDFSLNYRCVPTVVACEPNAKGEAPRLDFFQRSGSGKMTISALDYGRFLSALDRGLIVPKGLVEAMKADRLGFDSAYAGKAGPYAWKNGGCPDFEGKGRTCKTVAMTFPGDIQAYVTVNSDLGAYTGTIQALVGSAFDAALR
jgi:CubicO group peptidase (beta-lactamase class C family)